MFGAIFDHALLVSRLVSLGWMPKTATLPGGKFPTTDETGEAIRRYQAHHGLPVCGKLDGATEQHLCACRSCRFPDVMNISSELDRWPVGMVVSWRIETIAGKLNRTAAEAAYICATQAWMNVCGVKFEPSVNPKTARLSVNFSGIDGAGRVLAWSDLPDPTGAPRIQKFDAEENWVVSDKPKIGEFDFVRVATHELGHVLGMGHIASGNLLQPMYDATIRVPKAGDIAEAVARYGPSHAGHSTSSPSPAASGKIVVEIDGDIKSVSVTGIGADRVAIRTVG